MKKLLSLLLTLALLCALAAPVWADEVAIGEVSGSETTETAQPGVPVESDDIAGVTVILHSNDVHGAIEGYAKMAVLKDFYQSRGANVILADVGDFSQGDTAVALSQGANAVKLMELVGYDVVAPGNHDFDYGLENLQKIANSASFPILAANVTVDGQSVFDDHVILETAAGVKVGFFGLTTPEAASKLHPAKLGKMKFAGGEALCAIAQAQVDALRAEGADYVVCLGHLGVYAETAASGNRSVDLLNAVDGIDVFLDGHSHSTPSQIAALIGEDGKLGDTVLTSTGTKFEGIGAVILWPDGAITTFHWPTEDIDAPADGVVSKEIAAIRAGLQADYGAPFAQSKVALNGEKSPGNRTEETNAGDLISDAILWAATKEPLDVPAENVVAIQNGGSIRASIAAGEVTKQEIHTMLPFDNTVCVVYVPGKTLLEALEASTFCTPEPLGGFPQVAGLAFTVDTVSDYDPGELYGETTYHAPKSVGRVSIQSVNGKAFDPAATYAVVTNDFVAAGGDTYYALSVSPKITDTGIRVDQTVMDYITSELGGVIGEDYAAPQGRITLLEAPKTPEVPDEPKEPAVSDKPAVPAAGNWYDAAVADVTARGIMTGTGNGFEPQGTVTRAMVFQTLCNLEGRPEVAVDQRENSGDYVGKWYENAARWAYVTGLTTGTGAGFQGDRAVTRSEIVTILHRYAQYKDVDVSVGERTNILTYEDAENVPAWAVPAFQWAVGSKTVSGKSGLWLAPTDTATRAELAQILSNYVKTLDGASAAGDSLAGKSVKLNKFGNVYTDISAQALADAGVELGDILSVQVGDRAPVLVPYVSDYNAADLWQELVLVDEGVACLAINMGDFATAYGVGSRGDSVFSYVMTEQPITLALAQKGGYADALALRTLTARGDARENYPSDEAFANFREVTVGKIAPGMLYRSASPIAPDSKRAGYADKLLAKAGVKAIVDMADCRAQAPEYAGFGETNYAKVHEAGGTVYLNMGGDMYAQVGLDDLKNGLDFMAEKDGPYLIHCNLGKDRTGHLIFLLEALMGADIRDIVADYMLSYENLYDIKADSEAWSAIAEGTIEREIIRLLDAQDIFEAGDLAVATDAVGRTGLERAAETYLVETVGLTQSQVDTLKDKLAGK